MPSVMGGVMRVGPYLTTAAVAAGSRLLSRSKSRKGHKGHRAKSRDLDSRRRGTRRMKRSSRRSRTSRRYFT